MGEDLFVTLPSGCRICYQVFGNPGDPAILIIAGHSVSMTQKTDELVRLLSPADDPHYVIRYDHRDTGLSTSYPRPTDGSGSGSPRPAYALTDMVDDAVGLINHLGLARRGVHVVGTSLGGTIAWQVATHPSLLSPSPQVVRSLALVLTSPVGRQQRPGDDLPALNLEGSWLLAEAYDVPSDPDDHASWIALYARLDLCLAVREPTVEETDEARRDAETTYFRELRSGNLWTKHNHSDASGVRWPRELLREVRCPTVVVHAEKDQLFPIEHAFALRDEVEGATLVVLRDCGHEMPRRVRGALARAILENVRMGEDGVRGRS